MADTSQLSEADRLELAAGVVQGDEAFPIIWAISNRKDNRAALHERHPAHPVGGDGWVSGGRPKPVALTPGVEQALYAGEIRQVPEPPDGPRKPKFFQATKASERPDQPGQPTRLGRELDPSIYGDAETDKLNKEFARARTPKEIPVPRDVVMPKDPEAKK